jgi:hypothetical protein
MTTITTTEFRTKTPQLIGTLLAGGTVDIIHRSQVIGEIKPKKSQTKVFNAARFEKIIKELNFPHLSITQREKRYREAMLKKHGQHLS